jgi:hypothetical protein
LLGRDLFKNILIGLIIYMGTIWNIPSAEVKYGGAIPPLPYTSSWFGT